MIEKKYEFMDEATTALDGTILHRIRAMRAFGDVFVGDIGGFLEKEESLDHEGICWVSGSARVYGGATVTGDAKVSGDAWVYGGAWDASPLQIRGTKHFVTHSARGQITIGCIPLPVPEWLEQYEEIGRLNGYSKRQVAEYKRYIDLVTLTDADMVWPEQKEGSRR